MLSNKVGAGGAVRALVAKEHPVTESADRPGSARARSPRVEALEFSARRLASAADVLWMAAIAIAVIVPLAQVLLLGRIPYSGILLALIVLPVGWAARAALMLAVARAEVLVERTDLDEDVDSRASRSTS